MAMYSIRVLRPGTSVGVSGVEREYTEQELRDSYESLEGVPVLSSSRMGETSEVVGEVTNVIYDGGIECEVEIFDEDAIERIDAGLSPIAPSMTLDSSDAEEPIKAEDISFENLFLTPQKSNLVGPTERK